MTKRGRCGPTDPLQQAHIFGPVRLVKSNRHCVGCFVDQGQPIPIITPIQQPTL